MKTKRGKIYCCLMLIGAIVVSIGITASSTNIKSVLSDTEMGRMYGGTGDCEECKYNEPGCDPSGSTGQPYYPYCSGTEYTSCQQGAWSCENNPYYGLCEDYDADCSRTKVVRHFTGVNQDNDGCEYWDESGVECDGTRPFCKNP